MISGHDVDGDQAGGADNPKLHDTGALSPRVYIAGNDILHTMAPRE